MMHDPNEFLAFVLGGWTALAHSIAGALLGPWLISWRRGFILLPNRKARQDWTHSRALRSNSRGGDHAYAVDVATVLGEEAAGPVAREGRYLLDSRPHPGMHLVHMVGRDSYRAFWFFYRDHSRPQCCGLPNYIACGLSRFHTCPASPISHF